MRRIFYAITLMMAFCQTSQAQNKPEISVGFEEPDGLESKVVQCTNGNTFLFNFTKKGGIEVALFDKSRKMIASPVTEGKEWFKEDMKNSKIHGIYEINGQLVMFLAQLHEKVPMLFRIIFNTTDGTAISEQKIAEMPKIGGRDALIMVYSADPNKGFHIEKDPNSDNYAVLSFNGTSSDDDNRIEVVYYNGKHQEISRASYDSPSDRYEFVKYLGMIVDGEKQVLMATYAYNSKAYKAKPSQLFISRLTKGTKKMEHHPMANTQNFMDADAVLLYNTNKNILEFLSVTLVNSKTSSGPTWSGATKVTQYYRTLFSTFDPVSLDIINSKPLTTTKVSQMKKKNFGTNDAFLGCPRGMLINPDFTTGIVMDDFNNSTETGVMDIDANANEINGYAIRKRQVSGLDYKAFTLQNRWKNEVVFNKQGLFATNSGFNTYDFFSTENGRYVIFNIHPNDYDRPEDRNSRAPMIRVKNDGISDCNTVCYKFNNGKIEKHYLFGEPDDNFDNRFSFISAGHYLKSANTYATLMLEKSGKKKQAHIAWVKLD
jgi:hypothetical protein